MPKVIIFNFTYFSLLPVFFLCTFFYFWNKRKFDKESKIRKRDKDDLWHIVKEYLRLNHRVGCEIIDLTLYQRPEKKELNKHIYDARKEFAKEQALLNKSKFIKPKREKRYDIEDYFDALENQTLLKKAAYQIGSISEKIKRKRFVICFRVREKHLGDDSPWESIEIELFKDHTTTDDSKFQVAFNKALDYQRELQWIYPMQITYLKEKFEKAERAKKYQKKKKPWSTKLLELFRKPKNTNQTPTEQGSENLR